MELRRELVVAIGALVLLNALLAFGAIGLFVRMGPVIDGILQENVAQVVAAEGIVDALAGGAGRSASPEVRARVQAHLDSFSEPTSDDAERVALEALRARLPAALDGDASATEATVTEAGEIIRLRRDAMSREVARTGQLGRAGAWAAVLVGLASFVGSLIVFRRFRRRLVDPLVDVSQVLEDVRSGDRFRRARPQAAPAELRKVRDAVNALLDERIAPRRTDGDADPRAMRFALLHLLGDLSGPAVVTDRTGRVLAGNDAALEALAGEKGDALRAALEEAVDGVETSIVQATELPDGGGWIGRWDAG